ncbi:MAG: cobyrinate a,c-diamide synthase, partial [Blautia sp.]|nr:cobyrinate a,c-diamide synthase [Blautia sp.]
ARVTDTPVIFIVNTKGMSVSIVPYIKGFLEYKKDSRIKGVIFNLMSPMLYDRVKKMTEEELPVKVLGYVPKLDFQLESRHLGLVLPEEIPSLRENLHKTAEILQKTLDIPGILSLAENAPPVEEVTKEQLASLDAPFSYKSGRPLRIGLAKDEAFCFFYEDNFRLLREMGAELVPFSLIHDRELPERLDGLLLMGGYPELYAKELQENRSMRESVRKALSEGLPCIAECGGFMYLHDLIEGMDGRNYEGVGTIKGRTYRTDKLQRFGYIYLSCVEGSGLFGYPVKQEMTAHEFHYFDSENCGDAFHARKTQSKRGWDCIHSSRTLFAGFPHLYFYGNPEMAALFLKRCEER